MTLAPLGDTAVVVTLGSSIDEATLAQVRALAAALEQDTAAGIVDVVPAYTTVTVFYDPAFAAPEGVSPYDRIRRVIEARVARLEEAGWSARRAQAAAAAARTIEIPVCYGGEYGPDLDDVAKHTGLSADEVVQRHHAGHYLVYAVGFTPGFAYLGGLAETLFTPRRATPRTSVPAGSVGIGWQQTGVYPVASPGGWQLIGRTPLALFQAAENPPARLRVGDRVTFRAIAPEEFRAWK